MDRAQGARAVAWRQETLAVASFVANTTDGTITLRTHWFEHRGKQPSVYGCNLGDVERLAPLTTSFLDALPQASGARTVTQRARQVATPTCRHGYRGQALAVEVEVRV